MLGEVAKSLTQMAAAGKPSTAVHDGKPDGPVGRLLREMVQGGMFDRVQTPGEFAAAGGNKTITVIGRFSEHDDDVLFQKPERAIFINPYSVARPGQVKDGFFPDAVFSDPTLVLPLLHSTLRERLHGHKMSVPDLLDNLAAFGGLGAQVTRGAHTFLAMTEDRECSRFLTLSGAMTIAQMYLVIEDMIGEGMVHSVTSTGALMAHGLMPGMGLKHYKYNPSHDDVLLAHRKLNRVTDTLEPETNFDHAAEVIDAVLTELPDGTSISTAHFHRLIGKYLHDHHPHQRGILKTAYEKQIPVFVPAFVDSELGNDVYTHNLARRLAGRPEVDINPRLDQQALVDLAKNAQRMGIFSVGGGVPRNHIQNIAPLLEIANDRVPEAHLPTRMFSYGVRVSPDEMHFGHLSGCTYSENSSWRKFHPDARTAEIRADATIVWPLLVKYVLERRAR
jgi:deoxyhypusine synthase